MNNTFVRRMSKAIAMRNMQGNWLKYIGLTIVSYIALELILQYLPIATPTLEQLQNALTSSDYVELFNLYFPGGITQRMMLLMGIVFFTVILVYAPLKVGMCRYFIKVSKGEKPKFSEFLSPFSNIGTVFAALVMFIFVSILSAIWSVIFMAVPVGVAYLAETYNSLLLAEITLILIPVMALILLWWLSRYKFLWYIFTEGKSGGVFGSYREFMRIMRRHSFECVFLRATYFVWDAASSLLPLVSFFYSGLMETTYARYLSHLRGDFKVRDDEIPNRPEE